MCAPAYVWSSALQVQRFPGAVRLGVCAAVSLSVKLAVSDSLHLPKCKALLKIQGFPGGISDKELAGDL